MISIKKKFGDRMIQQLLNSVIAKCRYLSASRRSIICLSRRLWQIIDPLFTDRSRDFAQPRTTIVNYLYFNRQFSSLFSLVKDILKAAQPLISQLLNSKFQKYCSLSKHVDISGSWTIVLWNYGHSNENVAKQKIYCTFQ